MIASLTLLPALIGFAGRRTEVARWRGVIAAGFVAVALLGLGLKISPFLVGIPLAVDRADRQLRVGAAAPGGAAAGRRSRASSSSAYRWSRSVQHHPWRVGRSSAGRCWSCWPSRCSACASASPTRATTRRTRPPARPTTCSPRASVPASTARSCSSPSCPPGTDSPSSCDGGHQRGAADARRRASSARPRTNDPTNPTAAVWNVIPTTSPQDERDHRSRPPPARRRAPGGDQRHEARRRRHRLGGHQIDFSNYLAGRMPYFFGAVLGAVVPAADGGVPLAARAAQGRGHEPAVDRRRLRRRRRHLPVGLAERPHRHRRRRRSSRSSR